MRRAVDAFLSSSRCANPNTRRAYAGALDRVSATVGPAAAAGGSCRGRTRGRDDRGVGERGAGDLEPELGRGGRLTALVRPEPALWTR